MPLEILAPMVVIGIAGIALMLHLSGLSRTQPLTADRVTRDWLAQMPALPPLSVAFSDDSRTALIETAQGPGLLWVFGADTAARLFTDPPTLAETPDRLIVTTGDFTAPRVSIALAGAGDRQRWSGILTAATKDTP